MSKSEALENALRAADDRYIAALELALFVMKAKRLAKPTRDQAIAFLEASLKDAKTNVVSTPLVICSPIH